MSNRSIPTPGRWVLSNPATKVRPRGGSVDNRLTVEGVAALLPSGRYATKESILLLAPVLPLPRRVADECMVEPKIRRALFGRQLVCRFLSNRERLPSNVRHGMAVRVQGRRHRSTTGTEVPSRARDS